MRRKAIKIGLSARLFYPEHNAIGIKTKTLQVLEQSIAHWVMSRDVLVLMVPSILQDGVLIRSDIRLSDYAAYLDGLVLQGGTDVSPTAYGEEPLKPEWAGDRVRDAYEMELLHEFIDAEKPVLGICRGMQLINVAFGGSLYQDIATQRPDAAAHETSAFDAHVHALSFAEDGLFARWFGQGDGGRWYRSTIRASRRWGAISWWRRFPATTRSSKRSVTRDAASSRACSGIRNSIGREATICSIARPCSTSFSMPPDGGAEPVGIGRHPVLTAAGAAISQRISAPRRRSVCLFAPALRPARSLMSP